jgi:hypothetical protein
LEELEKETGHPAPKTSHKKTPQKRGLVVEKTCDTWVAIRLDVNSYFKREIGGEAMLDLFGNPPEKSGTQK